MAVFVMHLMVGASMAAVGALGGGEVMALAGVFWLMGIGLAQVVYVGPAIVVAWIVRRPLGLGMLIGAGLTLVLNSACYGSVMAGAYLS